ncbi:autotransporter assembly complex protein TamA [Salinarimonas soli]|uniref:Outer membrane protein assembly factor n=1 Tax=Salinarimonas soli TaxID=1638099 RepID=A0A5B2VC47_9HYPH|nr:autotransporter assembly complex family protein [Salinarimonas soli]KAA2236040.1 outer membrane protein assembly factor [Salinarimonas soli]
MRAERGPWARRGLRFATAVALVLGAGSAPALDLDPFGLFGNRERAPAPSADALPYAVTVEVAGGERALVNALEAASTLYGLRGDAPPDADALVRRAQADLPRLVDALWGAGHYNATVAVEVAGVPLRLGVDRTAAAAAAASAYRAVAQVPVRIVADPGPLFRVRSLAVLGPGGVPLPPEALPPRIVALETGAPARTADILAAQARIVDHFRAGSRPFVRIARADPVVVHPEAALDLTLVVEPGPVIALGEATIGGTTAVDHAVIRSFIYSRPGDPYSPEALASIRRSVGQIEALSSVRVRTPEDESGLDANGNLPLFVDVSDRAPRVVGASARYSTTDGPALRAYWIHRNLFGGAERLRIEGVLSYLTARGPDAVRSGDRKDGIGERLNDLGGRFTVSFLKPALYGTRNDLLLDANVARERTEGYVSRFANVSAGIRHRFAERVSAQIGVEAEVGQARDVLGEIDYTLVGIPASVTYDSTDRPLDPTEGVRATARVAGYPTFLGSSVGLAVAQVNASAYLALDEAARVVLAGRLGLGTIVGADLEDIPANRRFFAGGGGSVRGFRYRSLGPRFLGEPIGGRSLLEGSVEARIKVTDTIGIVPFVDAGTAFASSLPDGSQRLRVAAGLGLRYYTGIGPIRLDVATPVGRERGDRPVAIYIGFGQAF